MSESKNQQRGADGNLLELRKNKGQSEMALSRPFIDWLFDELNTKDMLDQLNTYRYANDEYSLGTLAANEFLEAPGGFTQKCFDEGVLAPGFTRYIPIFGISVSNLNAFAFLSVLPYG
jgi:hypothetical protein